MEKPFATPPAFGTTLAVAPDLLWLRMPLPFALDHVNLWLIREGDGWSLVDTGLPDRKTRDLWEGVFAGPMDGRPVRRLVVTHCHPDHIGLASWMTERFQVTMEATLGEWLHGRMLSLEPGPAFVEASLRFYRAAGFDEQQLALVAERGNAYGKRVREVPAVCQRIREGDVVSLGGRGWRVLVGEGHAPEHACLWCEELKVLISGDQILPSISPNVSVWPTEPEANPLKLFFRSLERFRELPDDTLVLPSHGLPFRGLRQRAEQLLHHHDDRLAETLEAARRPITARELLAVLFRRELDTHQLFFALGESLSHLHFLERRGDLTAETDAAGALRFRRR